MKLEHPVPQNLSLSAANDNAGGATNASVAVYDLVSLLAKACVANARKEENQ